jgi:hypothetical protein
MSIAESAAASTIRASRRRCAALVAQTAMGTGIRVRKLWELKLGVAVCAALALVAALWSLYRISLFPPELTPRSLEMATASTQVVVDTPRSAILDLRRDTYSLDGLTNRAVLLGNVMASPSVRESIAVRAGVPVDALRIAPPLTPDQPRASVQEDSQRRTTDILKTSDEYRLLVRANPSAPVLYIVAQTPTAKSAGDLANAAVDALRGYVTDLAKVERTPLNEQVRLVQLGQAKGTVINEGVAWEISILAFLLTFAASCATLIFLSRISEGWRFAAVSERMAGG